MDKMDAATTMTPAGATDTDAAVASGDSQGKRTSLLMSFGFAVLTFLLMTFMPGYDHMIFPALVLGVVTNIETALVYGPVVDFCVFFLFVQWVIVLVYLIRSAIALAKSRTMYRDTKGALTFEAIFCVPFAAYALETAIMYIPWKGKFVMDFVNVTIEEVETSVFYFLGSLAVLIIAGGIFLSMAKGKQVKKVASDSVSTSPDASSLASDAAQADAESPSDPKHLQ